MTNKQIKQIFNLCRICLHRLIIKFKRRPWFKLEKNNETNEISLDLFQ